MKNIKDINLIIILIIIIFITTILTILDSNPYNNKIKAFKNSEVLVCFETLVVSNSNWEISGVNIYNNNSAGYIEIKNCKVKK